MAAMLTFHPRRALLEATAMGQAFHLPVDQAPARLPAWEHLFELPPGKYTVWDAAFGLPGSESATDAPVIYRVAAGRSTAHEVFDYPGEYAQRFDGINKGESHSHPGPALYVGTRTSGIYIHGQPSCNVKSCLVVLWQCDKLLRAVAAEPRLSFAVLV